MTTLLLLMFGCAGEDEPLTEATFYDAYAKTACDQLFMCEPDSWRAVDGEPACHMQQLTQVKSWLGGECTSIDLNQAPECLDAMATVTCAQSLVQGQLPEPCWQLQRFDEEACFPALPDGSDRPAIPPG